MKTGKLCSTRVCIFGSIAAVVTSGPAVPHELVAIKPGLMCVSPDALARLTLPDGSSKTATARPSQADLAIKREGHCIDIQIGTRVTVERTRTNTTIVSTTAAGGQPQTYIVPNIDFQASQTALSTRFVVNEVVSAPGGNTNYYIKTLPGKGADGEPNMVIEATYNQNDSSNVLLASQSADDPKRNLIGFKNLFLSPDSKTLYFQTDAWATSNAVHSIRIATKQVSYVTAGEIACVVLAGQYQGDLVIEQHRYFVQGGSYDNLWLYDPSGKEIGLVAEDTDAKRVCPTLGN